MRRRVWLGVLAGAVLLVAADWAYWRVATGRLRQGLADWEASLRANGWEVGSGAVADAGWPLAARVSVTNLTLRHAPRGPAPHAPVDSVDVSVPAFTVSLPLLRPDRPELRVQSPLRLRVGDLPDMIVTADSLLMTADVHRAGASSLQLQGTGVRVEAADGGWRTAMHELVVDATGDPAGGGGNGGGGAAPDQVAAFQMRGDGISLPAQIRSPLGQTVSAVRVQGVVHGLFPASGSLAQSVEAWRNNGGSVEISHLSVNWGPLVLGVSATLALDEQLQPMGTGSAHIAGYAETLDRCAAAGLMTRSAATAAKAVLSLMAGIGVDGDPPAVDVPLILQYRTLSMRQVPLLRLPELDWASAR